MHCHLRYSLRAPSPTVARSNRVPTSSRDVCCRALPEAVGALALPLMNSRLPMGHIGKWMQIKCETGHVRPQLDLRLASCCFLQSAGGFVRVGSAYPQAETGESRYDMDANGQ